MLLWVVGGGQRRMGEWVTAAIRKVYIECTEIGGKYLCNEVTLWTNGLSMFSSQRNFHGLSW